MPTRASIALFVTTLATSLVLSASAPAAAPDPNKPLTCEGRCGREVDNCLKTARNARERADCEFERHACIAKCGS
jgi:hypothetical protein